MSAVRHRLSSRRAVSPGSLSTYFITFLDGVEEVPKVKVCCKTTTRDEDV